MSSFAAWIGNRTYRQAGLLAFLVSLAAVVRLFWIEHPVLWQDEIFTWLYTRETYAHHFSLHRTTDVHPPTFTVLLKAWISVFGDSRTTMRALPAFIGALSVPALFLIARNWLGLPVAILAGLFFVFHPLNVHYTREIRFYGVIAFAMLWATYFYLELLRQRDMPRTRQWRCAIGFTLFLALTFYLQYVSLLFMVLFGAATLLLLLYDRDWRLFWLLSACIAVAALLCIPQSVHFLGYAMTEGAVRNSWIAPTDVKVFYEQTMTAIAFPALAKIVVVSLYVFGALQLWKQSPRLFIVMMTFLVLGPLLFAFVGVFKPIYLARSFMGALVTLPILLAFSVMSLPRSLRPLVLLLLAIAHIWALLPDYPAQRLPNPGEAIAAKASGWRGATVYYDEQLTRELAAYRLPASNWHVLSRRSPEADEVAIASQLRRRADAINKCPPTILVFEQRPPFDSDLGEAWSAMVTRLARISPVRDDRTEAYHRFVRFE
ncbi:MULTISPECIES: glycosyltransferase family 39 protein [unclassified Sphingobium]|uniref:glycosyltransferase family 39 protein n=1 Tax=unclassified Sphingobium TaxID=2611147 RepID=UPI002224436C|nr:MULTISPECIES: glycosyltransferase family 39 protein [unclassified Sphingobium]MCW2396090.1 putative membrane protein [Sphingobium sp. B8D3B]MCW2419606.1 putative membrane protein [Sphingobium sp. B8D3C]